ncbi:hypothetical protein AURDEDRAFT_173373 [Auricularia subglabra TFB-10046 SS5]|uniref:Uncharacterized protein n=1 Tax=Auricularia subglabra (strain TFB-10046 / SS5) TaxID=717982 RepID=J0LHF6_AURST|nr:hypothetical protein AURDEDRAFT_173373 [Auricularia subglabra TFB-10046 SS5]
MAFPPGSNGFRVDGRLNYFIDSDDAASDPSSGNYPAPQRSASNGYPSQPSTLGSARAIDVQRHSRGLPSSENPPRVLVPPSLRDDTARAPSSSNQRDDRSASPPRLQLSQQGSSFKSSLAMALIIRACFSSYKAFFELASAGDG